MVAWLLDYGVGEGADPLFSVQCGAAGPQRIPP
jgi:hypothetical protein